MRYPALIGGETGAYDVDFPDLPGCIAMGYTVDEAVINAEDSLRDWVESMESAGQPVAAPSALENVDVPEGSTLTSILLVRVAPEAESVRLNLVLDAGVADAINAEAQRRGMTRKDYLEWMVRFVAQAGA